MPDREREDLEQAGFEIGEEITEALHYAEGCEAALHNMLAQKLAREPDRGQQALALLAAIGGFRLRAKGHADVLTRMCSG